jgi:hypothetical protein
VYDTVQYTFEHNLIATVGRFIRDRHSCLVAVYDPSDVSSWKWLFESCLPQMLRLVGGHSSLYGVLVATKMDRLVHDEQSVLGVDLESLELASATEYQTGETERVISRSQGEAAAADWNMGYCEVSSRTPLINAHWGVNRAFELVLKRQDDGDQMVEGRFPQDGVMTKSARKT